MTSVAILGANGFVGTRAVEMLHLGGIVDVRPIVRTPASLAPLSRFDLDARVGDARDQQALARAFAGCDVVVHAVAGSPELILSVLEPVYQAAQQAGVRRLIYLSSAAVHGQAPQPGIDERAPLERRQALPYNNAKVRAEQVLSQLRQRGSVELVVLRPGIVFGPRSAWVGRFADGLLAGEAYLVNGGHGVCNSIYVDNLIDGIHRAATASDVDGEAFLLGDREHVTWRDLYGPIARAMGFDLDQVPSVDPAERPSWQSRIYELKRTRRARALGALLPTGLRRKIAAEVGSRKQTGRQLATGPATAQPTLEMSLLQTCRYKLPSRKAERLLGYDPPVSFDEACRRTVGWMAFAGYPIVDHHSVV